MMWKTNQVTRESFCSSYLKQPKFLPVCAFLCWTRQSITSVSAQGNLKTALSTGPQLTLLLKMIQFPEPGVFHIQLGYRPVLHLFSLKDAWICCEPQQELLGCPEGLSGMQRNTFPCCILSTGNSRQPLWLSGRAAPSLAWQGCLCLYRCLSRLPALLNLRGGVLIPGGWTPTCNTAQSH